MFAIHQSDATLDGMDGTAEQKGTQWPESGLIDRVKASTIDEAAAEDQVISFLSATFRRQSLMCGNRSARTGGPVHDVGPGALLPLTATWTSAR